MPLVWHSVRRSLKDRVATAGRHLEGALAEVYVARQAFAALAQRYLDSRMPLFPDITKAVEGVVSGLEGLADLYNRSLVSEMERLASGSVSARLADGEASAPGVEATD